MQHAASLLKVDFCVSTSCHDPTHSAAWSRLRDFGRWSAFLHAFGDRLVQTELLPGDHALQIGARRVVHIGSGKLVEQLSAVDQDNKILVYKLITHPLNVNPFSASFVNYTCQVTVRAITMTGQSFVEMRGSFMTDPSSVEAMQFSLGCFHETCLRSLCHYLGHKDATMEPAHSMPLIGTSTKRVGTLDMYSLGQPQPIGRTLSAAHHAAAEYFSATDRQNSTDSVRSAAEQSGPLQ